MNPFSPIFLDFFPFFPGLLAVLWIPGVQTEKMGEKWGKRRNYVPSEDSPDACFGGPHSSTELEAMNAKQLKALLRSMGLDTKGTKVRKPLQSYCSCIQAVADLSSLCPSNVPSEKKKVSQSNNTSLPHGCRATKSDCCRNGRGAID